MCNLSEVKFKFLGQTKGFYLEVWKIDSVFLYQVYLLNYHNCLFFCEGLYLRVSHPTASIKETEIIIILNSRCESFSKTRVFLRAFQKLPQNVQQKKGGIGNAE